MIETNVDRQRQKQKQNTVIETKRMIERDGDKCRQIETETGRDKYSKKDKEGDRK